MHNNKKPSFSTKVSLASTKCVIIVIVNHYWLFQYGFYSKDVFSDFKDVRLFYKSKNCLIFGYIFTTNFVESNNYIFWKEFLPN